MSEHYCLLESPNLLLLNEPLAVFLWLTNERGHCPSPPLPAKRGWERVPCEWCLRWARLAASSGHRDKPRAHTKFFFFSFSFEMAGKLWENNSWWALVSIGDYDSKLKKKKGLKKRTGRIVAWSKEKRTRWTFFCPLNVIICKENGRKFELQQAVFRINPIFSCALVESERCLKKGVIQPQATRCSLFISLL